MSATFTVLGAGIVGACTALALQRDGWAVTLVDRDEPGLGCSFGHSGIIHSGGCIPLARPGTAAALPAMLLDPESPLLIRWRYLPRLAPWLARAAAASTPRRVQAACRALAALALAARDAYLPVLEEAGARDLVRATGEFHVYRTRAAFEAAAWETRVRRDFGIPVEELEGKALFEREPALSPECRYAHHLPASAFVVNPLRLVQRLVELFVRKGGMLMRRQVRAARPDGAGGAVLETAEGELRAHHLALCAGAWSRPLAASLGARVPLEAWRGYHVMVPDEALRLNGLVIDGEKHFCVTPMDQGMRVAGMIELASLAAPPRYERADMLLRLARALLPGFPSRASSRWMGHRPGMPDSIPVIGRSARQRNVYFAFGHGTLGLTFGAVTGQIVADLAAARQGALDPAPYRAERFC